MKKSMLLVSVIVTVTLLGFTSAIAHEGHEHHGSRGMAGDAAAFPGKSSITPEGEKALGKVVNAYLQIRAALSKDSLDGVSANAQKLAEEAGRASAAIKAMKAAHDNYTHKLHTLLDKMVKHANQLQGGDIAKVRKQFVFLSTDVFDVVKNYGKPGNVTADALFGYYCSMYPGYWVQESKDVGNPFYGSKMLKCADAVGNTKTGIHYYSKSRKGSQHKNMEHHM